MSHPAFAFGSVISNCGALDLELVEQGRIEVAHPEGGELRRLARRVGDLKLAHGAPRDEAHPGRLVENRGRVAEELPLPGIVVDGVQTRRRVLDPLVAGE